MVRTRNARCSPHRMPQLFFALRNLKSAWLKGSGVCGCVELIEFLASCGRSAGPLRMQSRGVVSVDSDQYLTFRHILLSRLLIVKERWDFCPVGRTAGYVLDPSTLHLLGEN